MPFKKVVLPEKVKCGGTKGEIVVAHGCRKTKRLICGMEVKNAVAYAFPRSWSTNLLGQF